MATNGASFFFGVLSGSGLCEQGRVAVRSFALGLSVGMLGLAQLAGDAATRALLNYWPYLTAGYIFVVHLALLIGSCLRRSRQGYASDYPVQWRAAMLGSACGASILTASFGSRSLTSFALYGITLSLFHFTEYLSIAYISPRNLNLDSFLLNHSKQYHFAMAASWFEYFVELYCYPELKSLGVVAWSGFALCAIGEALRKCAMLTAGSNFHHLVRVKREDDHRLVTSGVYAVCRHPSYAGWFLWSVGTQLLLANPVCLVAYTMVTWMFFRERVEEEEITLLEFFGEEYAAYQKRVTTGLPFIKGFKMEL